MQRNNAGVRAAGITAMGLDEAGDVRGDRELSGSFGQPEKVPVIEK